MRFLLIFFPLLLFSLSLQEILTHPKSYVRDFYLTQFMKETKSPVLAFKAYNSLYKKRMIHLKILSKFKMFKSMYRCVNVYPKYLKDVDIACILNNGLSLRSIAKLKREDLEYLYFNLPQSKEREAVDIILNKKFYKVFSNRDLGYYFIINYPNKVIDQPILDFSIFQDNYFYMFIKYAVLNNLSFIKKSLNFIEFKDLDDRAKWWLFLNAMTLKDYKRAKNILYSFKKSNDKINFWRWRLGDKRGYYELLKSDRVNFYTLWAYEVAHKHFKIKTHIIFDNIKRPLFNQENPWDVLKFWSEFKKRSDLFDFARSLDSYKSIALKAIVLDKAFHYKYNFFITPPIYFDKNVSFRAFVYAIARQESRFIPASVSRSYALGTMQVMPFLVKDYKGDIFKQFDYNQNIKIGVKHLKWLFKRLHNPLMVAYAYNGGIGFVKRKVIPYFKYKGRFEPFLSMELVRYDESREYGKKVIANYVIYSHIFGNKSLTLHKLLKK